MPTFETNRRDSGLTRTRRREENPSHVLPDIRALLSYCRGNTAAKSRLFSFGAALLGILLLPAGCGGEPAKSNGAGFAVPEDLNKPDCVIGVPQGPAAMQAGERFFNRAQIKYFNSPSDGYTAVKHKKIDAFVFDRHSMEYAAKSDPDLAILPSGIAEEHIVVGMPLKHGQLLEEVNRFIARYRADGTYKDMYSRWFSENPPPMPEIPVPENPARRLKVGTEGLNEPMNFYSGDGDLTGFDMEFVKRLALFLNAEVEVTATTFDALMPAVEAGRIDLLVANLNGTPERRERMLMSDDYVDSAISVMVHSGNLAESRQVDAITDVGDLSGKRVAYLTGSCYRQLTEDLVDGVKFLSFSDHNSGVQALRSNKADAVLVNQPVGRLFVSRFPDEIQIACSFSEDFYGIAFRKGSPLTEQASAVIRRLKESGELAELSDKWCGADSAKKNIPDFTKRPGFTGKNGTLRFAAEPTMEPMCYVGQGGEHLGLDVEIMQRVASALDMKFEFVPMNFGGLIEALVSGKVDAVGGAMSITEERKEKVDFAESHYAGSITVLARKNAERTSAITAFSQLSGKRIGILSGTTMDRIAQDTFPDSEPVYFNSFPDLPIALESGKIDAFLMEEPQARLLVRQRPKLRMLPGKLSSDEYAFLFSFAESELCSSFSEQIRKLKADGTLNELDKKWFSGTPDAQAMPAPLPNPPNGTLRYATVPQLEPFTFLRGGQVAGYDIEVAQRVASSLGYALEPVIMDWGGYLDAVASGKVRFGVGCTTVTEERKQKMLFSEPNYSGGVVVIVAQDGAAGEAAGGGKWFAAAAEAFASSFERTFVREDRWKLILEGLKVTVLITVLSAVLGTLLAFGVCAMRRSKKRLVSGIARGYIALMQGMPILVILMILYYVVFAKVNIDAVTVAVIGFSLNFAAYAGEMFRSGINGIPKGQMEAALALGFSRYAAFRKVILPQVLRRILPVYRGEFISMLKMTSIVGYIAIQDLTKMSDIIRSRTYEAFFPLIATAIIYFAAAHLLASGLTWLEFRLDPHNRRSRAKGGKIR